MKNILLFLFLFLFAGVAGGCARCIDCGEMKHSVEATRSITSATIAPEYNYYTYWQGGFAPKAILGLDKRFSIKSSFWKPAALEKSELAGWVAEYKSVWGHFDDMNRINLKYKGYKVLDPSGQQVGIYYSTFEWMTFKFLEDNVVEIPYPQPSSQQLILREIFFRE